MRTHRLKEAADIAVEMPQPFDFELTVHKPAGWSWSTPGEVYEEGTIWVGMHVRGVPVGVRLSASGTAVAGKVFAPRRLDPGVVLYVEREVESGLGKDLDLEAFYAFGRADPILARTIDDLYGMRTGSFEDIFGRVILAICLQMARLERALKMMAAILDNYGDRLIFDGREVAIWPSPEQLAAVDCDQLRAVANLGYRARLLCAAARFLVANPMTMHDLDAMPEAEAVSEVRRIPGIGPYAAGIVLRRNTAPLDAWSVIVMSELLEGVTPPKPRDALPRVSRLVHERWGEWSWLAFAYIVNDLEALARVYPITRLT